MKSKKSDLSPSGPEKRVFRRCVLFFFALSFLLYGKSIGNEYAMDDEYVANKNKQVQQGIRGIPAIISSTYVIDGKQKYEYRPLVKVSYAIEYQLFGENPHISHFINILLYAICVSLVLKLLLSLFPGWHVAFSFSVALLFLIHPLHSEVVMSLKNRDGIMSFIFCLLSLMAFLKYADLNKLIHALFGALLMLLAMISKKDAMPFYLLIPFTIWFFRNPGWKKLLVIVLSLVPVYAVFRVISYAVSTRVLRPFMEWENPLLIDSTVWERIPQGFYSLYFYLKMFLLPYPLISYYGAREIPVVGWEHPIVWIMLVLILAVLILVIRHIRSRPVWVYGVCYFLITISMFTNVLVPVVGIVGERFAFIASLGLCLLAMLLVFRLLKIPYHNPSIRWSNIRSALWYTLIVIGLLFGGQVFMRNDDWKDAYTLYATDVKKAPESAHLHTLLASTSIAMTKSDPGMSAKEKRMHVANALDHYKESIRIIPDYITSHNNIGMLYLSFYNKPAEAIPYLKKAIKLDTNYVEAFFNLAACETALGDLEAGERHYRRALELNPDWIPAYNALTKLYGEKKSYDSILRLNERGIARGLRAESLYLNVGNVHIAKGDTLKAIPYLEKALEINAGNQQLSRFLSDHHQRRRSAAQQK